MIAVEGDVDVIRGRLRRFPDRLIEEWLKELVELKMIAPGPVKPLKDFTFTGERLPRLPPLADEDSKRLAKTTVVAGASVDTSSGDSRKPCRRSSWSFTACRFCR